MKKIPAVPGRSFSNSTGHIENREFFLGWYTPWELFFFRGKQLANAPLIMEKNPAVPEESFLNSRCRIENYEFLPEQYMPWEQFSFIKKHRTNAPLITRNISGMYLAISRKTRNNIRIVNYYLKIEAKKQNKKFDFSLLHTNFINFFILWNYILLYFILYYFELSRLKNFIQK